MTPSSELHSTATRHCEVRIAGGGAIRFAVRMAVRAGRQRRFDIRGVCLMAA